MYIGKTIREIRLNKNIQSKELYKDLLSRPAIAKFEKGVSDTSVNKFFTLLERLNITLEEFEVIYNQSENKDLIYTRKYIEAFYNRNIENLKEIAARAEEDYNNSYNNKYKHYRSIALLLIDDLNKGSQYKDEIEVLKNYLMSCDSWGYYEIVLFSNSLSFYPSELIDLVYARAKKSLISYQDLTRYRNEIALTLFNIIEIKLINKELDQAKIYMLELEKIKNDVIDNMYIQCIIKFFNEIIEMLSGDKKRHTKILKIIDCFTFLELHNKERQLTELYENILSIYKISTK